MTSPALRHSRWPRPPTSSRVPPASYQLETLEEARVSRAKFNPSDWELEAWVSTYAAIATGELSIVSHTVQALTGHAPQTLANYLHRHPESYQHITATRL